MKSHEVLTLIEEITRNDGTKYIEISNMVQNGRAELAAERGFIKQVRILQLNIPHSPHVQKYERYINENYVMPTEDMDHFEEWKKTPEMKEEISIILKENHIA
ncbi:hypothetical protein [Lentilactobacillus hilgardii]|jgi:hypothetical protein|uniref:Uncharacterized protein n=1 Tax=Lentilactobacillus hilgardii TaxID=1588 RepID=A0A6P1E4Y2_LENHI|nr:hypothetical protein [Lentilactobacillus hilgardii]EEI70326.1 hypothetical protein HMPREF0496_2770 [Lentilactobacillus hilgardii ATCC 27305]MCT3392812.1 hypothetical protein [Lentilactobacillus hilgardii]QHB52307.1 hypothetical protein GQR93_08950 [Lentilactobacillus hilgardii]RRG09385.1 MAG: hypothetical protein DUD35_09330 [Lactobacillus sp.]